MCTQDCQGFLIWSLFVYPRTQNQDLAHELGFEYAKDLEDLLAFRRITPSPSLLPEHTKHIINTNNVHDIKKVHIL